MIQQDRNGIFDLLRAYHENVFSINSSNTKITELKTELEAIQEQVITMVLGFVYGRVEFMDYSEDLNNLEKRIKAHAAGTQVEQDDKELISNKAGQLLSIIELTKKSVVV